MNLLDTLIAGRMKGGGFTGGKNLLDRVIEKKLLGAGSGSGFAHGTWEDLFYHIDKGDYAAVYTVGEILPLDLGAEGVVNAQIVAFDADFPANGSGKAPVSFVSEHLLSTRRRWNPALAGEEPNYTEGTGTVGGWQKCELRQYLKTAILPLIPAKISGRILEVMKPSRGYDVSGTLVNDSFSAEDIWLPSSREIGTVNNYSETFGPQYTAVFSTNNARIKHTAGDETARFWFTRSASTGANFANRSADNGHASSPGAVANSTWFPIGFCVA